MSIDFCFIGPKFDPFVDLSLFEDDDKLIEIDENMTSMAHIMQHIGAFSSVSEARKNGWNKPIPSGWNEFKLPKRFGGAKLFIWNPTTTLKEFEELFC